MIRASTIGLAPLFALIIVFADQADATPTKSVGSAGGTRGVVSSAATAGHAAPGNRSAPHRRIRPYECHLEEGTPIGESNCVRTARVDGKATLYDGPSDRLQSRASS